MRLIRTFIFFYVSLFSLNANAQLVQLSGLDVRTIFIDDTVTLHNYINAMNEESIENNLKSKVVFNVRKNGKQKIKSRELYNSEGKIIYKVDYGWNKGRDSATVLYEYDSKGRLIYALNNNSIFGKHHPGDTIRLSYDENGRVIEYRSEMDHVLFTYNSIGQKDSVKFITYKYFSSPSTRRTQAQAQVYDTTSKSYCFIYDDNNFLKYITHFSGDTVTSLMYNEQGHLSKKNTYDEFREEYYFENGQMVKSSIYQIQYPKMNWMLYESCTYEYNNNFKVSCNCITEMDYLSNYSIRFNYSALGLLIEKTIINEKGKIDSRTMYKYDFY